MECSILHLEKDNGKQLHPFVRERKKFNQGVLDNFLLSTDNGRSPDELRPVAIGETFKVKGFVVYLVTRIASTDLDRTLNNEKLSRAAAIFGGNSSEHLSAVAASRVMLLEQERDVLEAMKRPTTLQELAMMEKEVEQLRETRRNLDDAAKQR